MFTVNMTATTGEEVNVVNKTPTTEVQNFADEALDTEDNGRDRSIYDLIEAEII